MIEDQSRYGGKAEPDGAQLKGPEDHGAGRVMTDQGIARGTRKGAKAEPTSQGAEVEQQAWRTKEEPGDHHTKAELEIRKLKADPSSWQSHQRTKGLKEAISLWKLLQVDLA